MTEEIKELPAVAKNVYYPCKKCGSETYHKVLAHKTPTSASIQCEICGSKKTYKLTKPKKTKTGTTRKRLSSQAKIANQWAELQQKYGTENTTPYKISGTFKVNEAINHSKFGIGYVLSAEAQKIEVVFSDSIKNLVHNR